ncbi:hypothetical protein [Salinarimonas sp.]|uniref:hypothetical protein n=1 Tax=Salinarimonas sp. TaxID=2766526 RepID=UPI00391D0C93
MRGIQPNPDFIDELKSLVRQGDGRMEGAVLRVDRHGLGDDGRPVTKPFDQKMASICAEIDRVRFEADEAELSSIVSSKYEIYCVDWPSEIRILRIYVGSTAVTDDIRSP